MDDFSYFRWVVLPALVVLGRLGWVRWRAREARETLAEKIQRQVKKVKNPVYKPDKTLATDDWYAANLEYRRTKEDK